MNPQQIARIVQNEINKGLRNVNDKTFYRGIVTAATGNKANVQLEGSSHPILNIICLDSYLPVAGDQVIVLSIGSTGSNYIILGKTDLDYTPPAGLIDQNVRLQVTSNDAFSVPNVTMTAIPYRYVAEDTHAMWDTTNKGFRAPYTGVYNVTAAFRAESTTNSYRYLIRARVNGLEIGVGGPDSRARSVVDLISGGAGNNPAVPIGTIQMYLKRDDFVQLMFYHTVGSTRSYPVDQSTIDTYLTVQLMQPRLSDPLISYGSFTNHMSVYWFTPDAVLTRDTTIFRTSPGSMRSTAASGANKSAHYYHPIRQGKTYRLTYWAKANTNSNSPFYANFGMAATGTPAHQQIGQQAQDGTNWTKCEFAYTANRNYESFELRFAGTATFVNYDDIVLEEITL